jgi:hypothetical protein
VRKTIWAFFTLLFPEYILVHAAVERKMAVTSLADMDEVLHHPKNKVWTLTHAYFANKGGVRVKRSDSPLGVFSDTPLTTKQLPAAIRLGALTSVPEISRKEIEDRSKSDKFTKGLALLQSLWLAASLITRAVQNLAVTQLEVVTIAFAVCTIITYGFCWYKPQDVQTPIYIEKFDHEPTDMQAGTLRSLQPFQLGRYLLYPKDLTSHRRRREHFYDRIPNDNFEWADSIIQPVALILCAATVGWSLRLLMRTTLKYICSWGLRELTF